MAKATNPQIGPATALVQLITEYPQPTATWYLTASGTLSGHLHADSFEPMRVWAERLGGSIRACKTTHTDPPSGRLVRTHTLHTVWRDVPLMLSIALPVPSVEDLLIEERHQLCDPAEPVMPGACRKAVPA